MKYIILAFLLIACTLSAQTKYVVIEARNVEINGKEYHGKLVNGEYGIIDLVYEVEYPLVLTGGINIDKVLKKAKSLTVVYHDDKHGLSNKKFLGAMPKIKHLLRDKAKAEKVKAKEKADKEKKNVQQTSL